jgi:hypothetical protein
MKLAQRQVLRREAYRIAILMIEPALSGDATLVEENDIDPALLKKELQRISDQLQKKANLKTWQDVTSVTVQ